MTRKLIRNRTNLNSGKNRLQTLEITSGICWWIIEFSADNFSLTVLIDFEVKKKIKIGKNFFNLAILTRYYYFTDVVWNFPYKRKPSKNIV